MLPVQGYSVVEVIRIFPYFLKFFFIKAITKVTWKHTSLFSTVTDTMFYCPQLKHKEIWIQLLILFLLQSAYLLELFLQHKAELCLQDVASQKLSFFWSSFHLQPFTTSSTSVHIPSSHLVLYKTCHVWEFSRLLLVTGRCFLSPVFGTAPLKVTQEGSTETSSAMFGYCAAAYWKSYDHSEPALSARLNIG